MKKEKTGIKAYTGSAMQNINLPFSFFVRVQQRTHKIKTTRQAVSKKRAATTLRMIKIIKITGRIMPLPVHNNIILNK